MRAERDPLWVRLGLIAVALGVVLVLIVIPVVNVFASAFSRGAMAYLSKLTSDPDTRHAIGLTLTVAPIAVVMNVVFGLAAAWSISRFDFPGRSLLVAAIDLPFAVSPVVVGLMFVLIFGLQGTLGPFLKRDGWALMPYLTALAVVAIELACFLLLLPRRAEARRGLFARPKTALLVGLPASFALCVWAQQAARLWPRNQSLNVIFATPGLVLVTAFVTVPFVARELIPVMDAVGPEEELAALSLGASPWQMLRDVTLPNVKWGLVYGVVLCNARAMGEFGAVYVVSGHVAGQTDTMPLRIEKLFQEYDMQGSFAVASLLTLLSIATLLAKWALARSEAS